MEILNPRVSSSSQIRLNETIGSEVSRESINGSPPDDGLKSLLSLLTGSPEATPGSSAQLSSKPIFYCFPDRPSSSVIKESYKPIHQYSSRKGCSLGKRIQAMSSRDIATTTAWLESLKQIASQDKCCGKVASEVDSMFSSLKDIEGEDQAVRAGKGAAFLAHKSFSRICWTSHEEKVFSKDPDALHQVQWEVLKVLMMLALSVYDMEDFIHNVHQEELNAERRKFTKALFRSYKTANEAILAIGDGVIVENFPLLYECDVNNVLEQWRKQSDSHQNILKVWMAEHSWMFEDTRVSEVLTECAITLMKHYPPLKRDCAMHLIVELARDKCCCIRDALFLECWGLFNFEHLSRLMPGVPFVELENLACEIFNAVSELLEWKVLKLRKSMESATFPLLSGVIGTFTEEVIEVVEHADCERRLERHRFIGTHHLLLGLLRTRIWDSVLVFVQLGHGTKKPSKYPASYIYVVARNVAHLSGEEKIDLEHLFCAIMFINLFTNERANDIYEVLLDKLLTLRSKVLILSKLCMDIEYGVDIVFPEEEGIPSDTLLYGEKEWNADLNSKMVHNFFEGVNECIVREKGFPTCVILARGRALEGSVWDFIRTVSRLWESASNLLPVLRENGGELGLKEGED
ncbi:hypothetical protein Vadar_017182 [Vaccinium darrowii]|uniref:Uncharacterized protein n=1 Tax=Vaccinium darrowii TaxID=229202 RepID=A0ACB7XII3_9ERIC|nr:hypothetical protein Vadar_017182 [Vaccinium darrowii]